MRAWVGIVLWIGTGACNGEPETSSTTKDTEIAGACGEVSSTDVSISGTVEDADGLAASGVELSLVERNWAPGTVHGTARSDDRGAFSMDARDLPVVEDCWGTAVQFWLEGTRGDLFGEKPMNSLIINAHLDGSDEVDLGAFPLVIR